MYTIKNDTDNECFEIPTLADVQNNPLRRPVDNFFNATEDLIRPIKVLNIPYILLYQA